MNLGYLAGEFMLIDNEAPVSIDNVDPSISRGRVNHLVDFVQVQPNHIFAVPINHLRQLIVNIPMLNKKLPRLVYELEDLDAAVGKAHNHHHASH
jgi:hypothetical protein